MIGLMIATLLGAPPGLETRCSAGNALSCTELGFRFERGLGVKADDKKAFALYRRACDLGHQPACAQLGLMYKAGRAVPVDVPQALALFRKACDARDPLGCSLLGLMHAEGAGVPKDERAALRLYGRACEAGFLPACTSETVYEFEDVRGASHFTHDRAAVPGRTRWRVYQTSAPDAGALHFTPAPDGG